MPGSAAGRLRGELLPVPAGGGRRAADLAGPRLTPVPVAEPVPRPPWPWSYLAGAHLPFSQAPRWLVRVFRPLTMASATPGWAGRGAIASGIRLSAGTAAGGGICASTMFLRVV